MPSIAELCNGAGDAGFGLSHANIARQLYCPQHEFSAFTGSKLTRPTPVRATDGRIHLVYELVLTNTAGIPVVVDRAEVRDAACARAGGSGGTDQRTAWLPGALGPATVGPRGAVAGIQLAGVAPGSFAVRKVSPIALGPPVGPGIWVADEGCCAKPIAAACTAMSGRSAKSVTCSMTGQSTAGGFG